jgi:peroxidase
MEIESIARLIISLASFVWMSVNSGVGAQLQVGFYDRSCSAAEGIIQQAVSKAFSQNSLIAAGLIRMHFHDCFVNGCDGSILLDSTPGNKAEKDAPGNINSLKGYEVIDEAKKNIEAVCKGLVSCADIIAFAARDSARLAGGISWEVRAGRRDGNVSKASDVSGNLVPPTFNLSQVTQRFAVKGLTQEEMVTLSGAHTVGRSHCLAFTNRLYNFSKSNVQDPTLDRTYADTLKQKCSQGNPNPNTLVPMDSVTPTTLDNFYYKEVKANRGLFTSDQTLLSDPATADMVTQNSVDALLWSSRFGAAMVRMGEVGVLTGSRGEIRFNCHAVNS